MSGRLADDVDVLNVAEVESLPRRTAHAAHALLECASDLSGEKARSVPTAAEVMLYDVEALSVRATGRALAAAASLGLAVRVPPRYWVATNRAHGLRRELEDRFLRETA